MSPRFTIANRERERELECENNVEIISKSLKLFIRN